MTSPSFRPALRPIETIVVPDARYGKVLVLRDTQGLTDAQAAIPAPLVPIVARFTGEMTCAEIAKAVSREARAEVPVELVVRLAKQLDEGLFLDSATSRKARARIEQEFASAAVRPASHAGGAYHGDPAKLAKYLDADCIAAAAKTNGAPHGKNGARVVGLVAPHIDPWRGAVGYGHAYGALSRALPDDVDTFVVLGTSHAPMREHFALCKKAFATPLGDVPCDDEAMDRLAAAARFDPYADQFNHKREHSLEFQVVFLKHLMKERPFRIVPVLAGLGEHQARGSDPAADDAANRFLGALAELVAEKGSRCVVVAGADMAHVGPRFGDPEPFDAAARAELAKTDKTSLELAIASEHGAFWSDVTKDLHTRRVCGLGPIYSLLRAVPKAARGEVLHYEQTVDKEDGSIVSHAAVAFYE